LFFAKKGKCSIIAAICHSQGLVAEDQADGVEVNPGLYHPASGGMAEVMEPDIW